MQKQNDQGKIRTLETCLNGTFSLSLESLLYKSYSFTDVYAYIRTSRHLIKKKFPDANHDPTPAPQRPPPARSVEAGRRRDEETEDREVDLISSYFEKGMIPGLRMRYAVRYEHTVKF